MHRKTVFLVLLIAGMVMASGQAFGGKASVKKYEVKPLPCLAHFPLTQGIIKGSIMDYCGDEIRKNYKIVEIRKGWEGQVYGATLFLEKKNPAQSIADTISELNSKAIDKAKGICEFFSIAYQSPMYYVVDHFNLSLLPATSQLPVMEIGYTCNIICLEKKKP